MSKIEWTDATWNPTTGCTKVSQGCKHCYAESMSKRLKAMGVKAYANGFDITLHPERLEHPKQFSKSTMFFVNSMSDLFHAKVPINYIDKIMAVIQDTPRHRYQILTKRAATMADYFAKRTCPENVWLGISIENRKQGMPRLAHLRKIQAQVRFLSIEPLLEDLGELDLTTIDWVIVGGESGHKARPMDVDWVDNIHRQCKKQKVSFFFKQWGAWGPDGIKRSKKANGRLYKGKTWDLMPSVEYKTKK